MSSNVLTLTGLAASQSLATNSPLEPRGRSEELFRERSARGFSLVEVIVATIIATLVITGLAYTFGLGRGFIDRYEIARAALAEAQGRMEQLAVKSFSDSDLGVGSHTASPFTYQGQTVGTTIWTVASVSDPGTPAIKNGLKEVTVEVVWTTGSLADTVRLNRLFPAN